MDTLITNIKALSERPDWDSYFIIMAYLISKRSTCKKLNVGCVITNNNRVISTGYNGHIPGAPHDSLLESGHEQMTVHAETNAVADAAKRGVILKDATAYVTHYPCINCTKTLISAGIKNIIYAEDYNNNGICEVLYKVGGVKVTKYG